jgi:hypothetical protein
MPLPNSKKLMQCIFINSDNYKTEIKIEKYNLSDLVKRLVNIRQYADDKRVKITIEDIDVTKIRFLTKYIKSYKYTQIGRFIELYEEDNMEFFECAEITYTSENGSFKMPITPPLVEEHGGLYYLIEGNSRLTYLIKERKAEKVKLLVVCGVTTPLPSTGRFESQAVIISDEDKKGDIRYEQWSYNRFRHIEETVRKPSLYLEETNGKSDE